MSEIRWHGFSHQEIYDAVHRGPGREISSAAERAWGETEALILRVDQRIAAAMAGSAAGWQ
ncbi:MAG: PPE domain-containing protein, partial [Actinomycetes bacterium]